MRTSLNNIKTIDDYVLGKMAPSDRILFEANIILNGHLKSDVQHQEDIHLLIKYYGRKKMKDEILAVQKIFTTAPQYHGFMQRIICLFK